MFDSTTTALQEELAAENSFVIGEFHGKAISKWRVSVAIQILEFLAILAASDLVYLILNRGSWFESANYFAFACSVGVICWFNFAQGHLYDIRSLLDENASAHAIIPRWTVAVIAGVAISALAHFEDSVSRIWIIGFYACGILALFVVRSSAAFSLRRGLETGRITQSVVVYGDDYLSESVAARLSDNPYGIRVVGLFHEDSDLPWQAGGPLYQGNFESLVQFIKRHHIDTVVIALPVSEAKQIEMAIKALRQQPVNIRVLPGELGLEQMTHVQASRSEIPGLHLISIADRPMSEFALLFKSIFDRVAAVSALIVAAPVFLICIVGIKLSSPGPVFFRQKRVGFKGHEFEILKFRTMHVSNKLDYTLTQRNDPRLFKFGSLMRKASFDELPQLINVMKGDMSLVGPRPHMPEARAAGTLYFDAVNEYAGRHRVKPGLTGWAQVNGWRGPTDTITQIERRVEHDLYYIENWSLTLDVLIVIRTFLGLFSKNAF